ncbi:MAG: ABC transporter substrate-binding protein [Gemmiger sp.]
MKRLHRSAPVRMLCLALACLAGLTACAPGGAEPAPIEVPPPVEQTNEGLNIWYTDYGMMVKYLDAAVTQYNQLHPDHPVTADKYFADSSSESNDEATQQMLTEVMAGSGPDLIFFDVGNMDIEKMVRRGVFADLEPYFEADNFDWSGYNQAVMDAGVWDGHRLVIPLQYNFPMLYTSQTALDETGFSIENCDTFGGLLDEIEAMQADPSQTREVFRAKYTFYNFAQYAGIPYVDYDRQKADLSSPELKRGAEIYNNLGGLELGVLDDGINGAADIRDGKALWNCPFPPVDGFYTGPEVINTFDDMVMMPIRDVNGGIQAEVTWAVAVRNNSPNLQNAYEFIKYLLSEEYHTETLGYRWLYYSVLDSANEAYFQDTVYNRAAPLVPPENSYGLDTVDVRQEDFDELMDYTRQITGAYFDCSETLFMRNMRTNGFLSGEVSFEDAAQQAERQMDLYLSE